MAQTVRELRASFTATIGGFRSALRSARQDLRNFGRDSQRSVEQTDRSFQDLDRTLDSLNDSFEHLGEGGTDNLRDLNRVLGDVQREMRETGRVGEEGQESLQRAIVASQGDLHRLGESGSQSMQRMRVAVNDVQNELRDVGGRSAFSDLNTSTAQASGGFARLTGAIGTTLGALSSLKMAGASAIGGTLIPMVGSLTTSVMGLASSAVAAGGGFGAFALVAIPALKGIFEAQEEITKAEEKLANADTAEKRAEALKELNALYAGLSKEQREALKELQEFKTFFADFTKEFERPVFAIFADSLRVAKTLITQMKPVVEASMKAMQGLMDSFQASLKTDDMKAFFDYLAEYAGPAMQAWGKIAGNLLRGVLNLMTAFAPASVDMQDGLLGLTESFAKWTSSLRDSQGFKTFLDYTQRTGKALWGIVEDIGSVISNIFKFAAALAPVGEAILNVGKYVFDLIKRLSDAAVTFSRWEGFIPIVLGVASALATFRLTMIAVTTAQKAWNTIQKISTALMAAQRAAHLAMVISGGGVRGMLLAMRAAMASLNLTMLANPFVLVAALLVGLGVALVAAYKKSETFRNILNKAWASIKAGAKAVIDWFTTTIPVWMNNIVNWFKVGWNAVVVATKISFNAVKNFLTAVWNGIKSFFTAILNGIIAYFKWSWNNLKTVTTVVFNAIKAFLNAVWSGIKTLITNFLNGIRIIVTKTWDTIKNVTTTVFNWIKNFLSTLWNGIKNTINTLLNTIKTIITNAWNNIKTITTNLGTALKNTWNTIKTNVSNLAKTIYDNTVGRFKDMYNGVKGWMGKIYDSVVDNFQKAKDKAVKVWNGFMGTTEKFVNNGIVKGVNWILDKLGADPLVKKGGKLLSLPRYAKGTGGHPGGPAIVGDGGKSEYVHLPNGQGFLSPDSDTLVPNMPRGTIVVNGRKTAQMMREGLIPAYETGVGLAGIVKDKLSAAASGTLNAVKKTGQAVKNTAVAAGTKVKDVAGDVWEWASEGAQKVVDSAFAKLGVKAPTAPGVFLDMGKGMFGKAKDGAVDFIQEQIDALGFGGGFDINFGSPFHKTSSFGMRNGKPHKGLDFAAPAGTPIPAQAAGEVIFSGIGGRGSGYGGYGNTVHIKGAGGLSYLYAHNTKNLVKKGDKVSKGQIIGTVGNTGDSRGNHVHFEIRKDGKAIDPESMGGSFAGGNFSGSGAEMARKAITQALKMEGKPSSWLNPMMTIAQKESGFNPNAINLWDINARRGDPSIGLFQIIGSTFRQHMRPGYGNRRNPLDSALAAIRYMDSRYGGVFGHPGIKSMSKGGGYKPYAKGGKVHGNQTALVGEEGAEILDLPGGSEVFSHKESMQIIGNAAISALKEWLSGTVTRLVEVSQGISSSLQTMNRIAEQAPSMLRASNSYSLAGATTGYSSTTGTSDGVYNDSQQRPIEITLVQNLNGRELSRETYRYDREYMERDERMKKRGK